MSTIWSLCIILDKKHVSRNNNQPPFMLRERFEDVSFIYCSKGPMWIRAFLVCRIRCMKVFRFITLRRRLSYKRNQRSA